MIKKAVAVGNNNVILNRTFPDAVSARAYSMNAKAQFEGLFEFRRPLTPGPFQEASPWDWWDSTTVVTQAALYGQNGNTIHLSGKATNPDMSAAKGRRYIDTVLAFAAPRMIVGLNMPGNEYVGIAKSALNSASVSVYPNPVTAGFTVSISNEQVQSVSVMDMNGRVIRTWNNLNTDNAVIERGDIAAGVYLVKVKTKTGEAARQVIFK